MLKAALTVACLGCAATAAYAQDAARPPEEITPDRYQIVFTPDVPADALLLDTSTGRVWRMSHVTDVKGDPDVWMYMLRVDSEAEKLALYAEHGKKAGAAPSLAATRPTAVGATKARQ